MARQPTLLTGQLCGDGDDDDDGGGIGPTF